MMAPARVADLSQDPAGLPRPPGPSPRDILVIRGGAIGDFILTLPVLAALRQRFPQARLSVLGRPHIPQLAQVGGLADEVHSIEARWLVPLFVREGDLGREAREFFARFDLVVSYLSDPDGIFYENLTRYSGARLIAGPHRPDESLPLHATEVFLKPLEALGIGRADPVPRLPLGAHQSSCTPGPETSPPTVSLHPGSGSERKNWPELKWDELISRLLEENRLDVLLVGGEAEASRLDRLAAGRSSPRLRLARHLPLVDLARRLEGCTAFVGHDSGLSHLAAALGLPCVILWGDSVETVWRPQSDRCIILRDAHGLPELPVSRVLSALLRLVEAAAPPRPAPLSRDLVPRTR
jgi:heptosyltransferase-2